MIFHGCAYPLPIYPLHILVTESNGIQGKHLKTVKIIIKSNNKVLLRPPGTQYLTKGKFGRYVFEMKYFLL